MNSKIVKQWFKKNYNLDIGVKTIRSKLGYSLIQAWGYNGLDVRRDIMSVLHPEVQASNYIYGTISNNFIWLLDDDWSKVIEQFKIII